MDPILIAGAVFIVVVLALFVVFNNAIAGSYDEGYQYGLSMCSHPADRAEVEAFNDYELGAFERGALDALRDHPHGLPSDNICGCNQGRMPCSCKPPLLNLSELRDVE